jgi:hypothetical protein
LPISEAVAAELEKMGRQVAEAVARGELQRARELTEEAILLRASEAPLPDDDAPRARPLAQRGVGQHRLGRTSPVRASDPPGG